MAAELEINARILSLLQMVGLVVQQDAESLNIIGNGAERLAGRIGAVIAADNRYAGEFSFLIAQQTYARFFKELFGLVSVAVVFMISENRPDGSFKPVEIFGITALNERPHTSVHKVTGGKYKVGIFRIYCLNPPLKFGRAAVVT
ncbi:MAG: hypothetical protein BWY95_02526 [Bacteroidetes bacterium ADurb.BinA104]|jgi:hypothetical protein|nr:MAG: hypothetical protein BWY95_02526 [Bacteroidetes bacterium ADurb.BinA104]